jgi:hypothetical protein
MPEKRTCKIIFQLTKEVPNLPDVRLLKLGIARRDARKIYAALIKVNDLIRHDAGVLCISIHADHGLGWTDPTVTRVTGAWAGPHDPCLTLTPFVLSEWRSY